MDPTTTPTTPTDTTAEPASDQEGAENVDEGQVAEETSEGASEEQQEEQPVENESFNLKINGKEVTASRDEVIAMAQKAAAAQEMFQEAADTKKQVSNLLERLQSDPLSVLKRMNVNVKDLAEDYLYNIYKREEMPEDQRKSLEKDETLSAKEKELQEKEKEIEERRLSILTEQYQRKYDQEVTAAMQSSGLPVTRESISRVANYMLMALNSNQDLSAADAVKLVENDYMQERKRFTANPDDLVKYLGEDGLKTAYETYMKKKGQVNRSVNDGGYQKSQPKSKKIMSWADLRASIGDLTDD